MNVIAGPEDLKELRAILEQHCANVGRNPEEISNTVHVPMRIVADEKKAAELRRGKDWNMIGPTQYVIDRCGDFIDAGVNEFCLQSLKQQPDVYQQLNEEIFPAFD